MQFMILLEHFNIINTKAKIPNCIYYMYLAVELHSHGWGKHLIYKPFHTRVERHKQILWQKEKTRARKIHSSACHAAEQVEILT